MTDKERREYVFGVYFKCIKPITNIRKGKTGCEVGKSYWLQYIHDTGDDNEYPDAESFYRKLSNNDHYDEVYITDDELINNFEKVIDGREVVEAIGVATSGEYVATNSLCTLMGGTDVYDEKGRKVSVDPNYISGHINICGKTYPLTRKGWDVYIWKPEYPNATYTWTWKKDREKYLFAIINLEPDYVRRYWDRKANEELEYKKKFVKEGKLICDLYHRHCEDPKDDTVISLLEYEGKFAVIELQWIYEKTLMNGTKCQCSTHAEQTWENVKGFQYVYDYTLKHIGNEIIVKNNMLKKLSVENVKTVLQ
jgi:hypothetical protein